MHPRIATGAAKPTTPLAYRVGRVGVLLLPAVLLTAGALHAPGNPNLVLWLGALFQYLACSLVFLNRRNWVEPVGSAVIMLYVIALSWMLIGAAGLDDWFLHLSQAVLLVVPLGFFAAQCLRESGAPALRRARQLAQQLARRPDWPADLDACRRLPEVKALREALHVDASPALALLTNHKPQVRIAALAALEFRQDWRPGQGETVLNAARRMQEPEVRAAAVYALANRDDRDTIEGLADFLCDPSRRVRQAATESLLWNSERRWPWIRLSVRLALADPVAQDDGPLRHEGRVLTPDAVTDLTVWAAEKGILALRAAQTLGLHYGQVLAAGPDPELVGELRRQLADAHAPAMVRLEIARLLNHHHELDAESLRQLLTPATPAPVRLIAVDALLAAGESAEAVAALHDLARLPNREIALSTADVVQRRLGVDLGLPRGQPLPPVHSRLASEVARRVLLWASQVDAPSSSAVGSG
jgi:hypothetical protein